MSLQYNIIKKIQISHMCWIPQPQHYKSAAGENWDIGPLRRGPSKLAIIVSFCIYKIQESTHLILKDPNSIMTSKMGPGPLKPGLCVFSLLFGGLQDPSGGNLEFLFCKILKYLAFTSTFYKKMNHGTHSGAHQKGTDCSTCTLIMDSF